MLPTPLTSTPPTTSNRELSALAEDTLKYLASISEVQSEKESPLSAYVNCTFSIGYRNFHTVALIDTGNTFGTAVSEEFASTLGYTSTQLQPSPTDMVKQAGEGATLKIVGLLPSNVISDFFKMDQCPFKFPIHPIFVIRGLHQTVNISLPFLQKFKFIIDLEDNKLQFKPNNSLIFHSC